MCCYLNVRFQGQKVNHCATAVPTLPTIIVLNKMENFGKKRMEIIQNRKIKNCAYLLFVVFLCKILMMILIGIETCSWETCTFAFDCNYTYMHNIWRHRFSNTDDTQLNTKNCRGRLNYGASQKRYPTFETTKSLHTLHWAFLPRDYTCCIYYYLFNDAASVSGDTKVR